MATPTPGKPSAVAATPPVSTPFSQSHLTAFSPHAPRSSMVPSPQQVRKSPANSNTLYGHPTFGSINFDSPSTAAALGLSDMTMELPLMPKSEDDQKIKLQRILDIFKPSKGRITEEGLERLIRRLGLTFIWETDYSNPGVKKLFVAGVRTFSIEISFTYGAVGTVVLDIVEANDRVTKYQDKAADVFRKNLDYLPGESALTTMLDAFAENLERFSALDKLSVIPGLHCHEAVLGIHDSLERIYNWEVAQLKAEDIAAANVNLKPESLYENWLSRRVMCTKSGRPAMHTQLRVGLSIEYWQEKRLISTIPDSVQPKTWALVVECTEAPDVSFSNPPEQPYSRVRVSDAWVSPSIQKSNPSPQDLMNIAAHNTLLDWLEPDLTLVPATDASKADAVLQGISLDAVGLTKLPDVMFSAKFEPPLAVPNYIADWIYNVIQATPSLFPAIVSVTVDQLILPFYPGEKVDTFHELRTLQRQKTIPVVDQNSVKKTKLHQNTLQVQKFDHGYELHNLPFSHPRQLVEILPYLRQYAFLATLLQKSFGIEKTDEISTVESGGKKQKITSKRHNFERFMLGMGAEQQEEPVLKLDVLLITEGGTMQHPFRNPRIQLIFPFHQKVAIMMFEIGLNGSVRVIEENVLPQPLAPGAVDMTVGEGGVNGSEQSPGKKLLTREDLGRILEICEDLGVFAEYICKRLG